MADEKLGGIQVISLPMKRPYWPFDSVDRGALPKLLWHLREDFGETSRYDELIHRSQPEVIHTHTISGISTGIWRAAAAARIPIIHTLHDYYLLCPRYTRFRDGVVCPSSCATCRLLTIRRRRDTSVVTDVVGISKAVLQPHREEGLFSSARTHVVINPIRPLGAMPRSVDVQPVTFGFLGRVTIEKGIEDLARSFGLMNRDARLIIGGHVNPTVQARLCSLAKGKSIEFTGFIDPVAFFRKIDVLVVPSIWAEPLAIVILEAQTAGRPAVGSTRGGIMEAIGSEAAGWFYNPDDPLALPSLLDRIAANPHSIVAKAAAALAASERTQSERVAESYAAIYSVAARG